MQVELIWVLLYLNSLNGQRMRESQYMIANIILHSTLLRMRYRKQVENSMQRGRTYDFVIATKVRSKLIANQSTLRLQMTSKPSSGTSPNKPTRC